MPLTKQDIDALVDGVPQDCNGRCVQFDGVHVTRANVLPALYLAAGLTAEGERKPERVRCWMHKYTDGTSSLLTISMGSVMGSEITPGWFVPDGAE